MRIRGLFLAALAAGCMKFAGPGGESGPEYDTTLVERTAIRRSVIAHGSLSALVEVEVKSEASGLVDEILVERGDEVVQGQPIVILDGEVMASRLRQAQAGLANAESALGGAELELRAAQRDLGRVESLYEQGFATEEELLASRDRVTAAELSVAGARAIRDQAAETVSEREDEVENATILAPQGGLVLALYVEEGTAVASATSGLGQGTPIALIGDLSTMRFVGLVDETEVGQVAEGLPVQVTVQSHPDDEFPGTLYRVYPQGISQGGVISFQVEVRLPNPDRALLPSMTGEARVVVWEEEALSVSDTALVFEREKTFAWIEQADGLPEKVEVTLGRIGDLRVEIVSGADEGDVAVDWPSAELESEIAAARRRQGGSGGGEKPSAPAGEDEAAEEPSEESAEEPAGGEGADTGETG